MNMMSSFGDYAINVALKVPGVSATAYTMLLAATQSYAPGMLKISSICYNSLLNDESKDKIATFIQTDPELTQYYNKYIILTVLMKNEITDPYVFFKANEALVSPLLASLHINIGSVDSLKSQLNDHIQDIINKIKENKALVRDVLVKASDLVKLRTGGNRTKFKNGNRKSRMKRRRTFRIHRNKK